MATSCPLLDSQFTAAKAVVFNICGPPDLTLAEVNNAAAIIYQNARGRAGIRSVLARPWLDHSR